MHEIFKTLLFLICMIYSNTGFSHPVIYKSGYVLSTMLHRDYSHIHANYSLTSNFALGLNYESFRPDTGKQDYYYGQANYLLKRFHQTDSQGNIYAKLGAGFDEIRNDLVFYSGIQADWETRTIFTELKVDALYSEKDVHQLRSSARIGISPYEAEYDEMQAWLIVQFEHDKNDSKDVRITPLMRFFYKTALWEVGSDLQGNWLLHFMVHI